MRARASALQEYIGRKIAQRSENKVGGGAASIKPRPLARSPSTDYSSNHSDRQRRFHSTSAARNRLDRSTPVRHSSQLGRRPQHREVGRRPRSASPSSASSSSSDTADRKLRNSVDRFLMENSKHRLEAERRQSKRGPAPAAAAPISKPLPSTSQPVIGGGLRQDSAQFNRQTYAVNRNVQPGAIVQAHRLEQPGGGAGGIVPGGQTLRQTEAHLSRVSAHNRLGGLYTRALPTRAPPARAPPTRALPTPPKVQDRLGIRPLMEFKVAAPHKRQLFDARDQIRHRKTSESQKVSLLIDHSPYTT